MAIKISVKCDQMPDGWNYDLCWKCKHFIWTQTKKGSDWRCKLNRATATEKNVFRLIWAENLIINRGAVPESFRSEIEVEFVGKKKRGAKKDEEAPN